ncbi:MAG: hypothetical protein ACTSO7_13915 [Candidatus Heimdallarchaeota archaeon]
MTRQFLFFTLEGETYSPYFSHIEESGKDSNNLQIIGFAKGNTEQEAFSNLVKENDYLLETTFNELTAIELKDSELQRNYFFLNSVRPEFEKIG